MSQARLAIAQSKATLDQALESMVSGFVLLDGEQRVVQWNSRFEEIFPWLRGVMAPMVPFRRVMEETARHHLPRASEEERMRWVELRLLKQNQHHEPHEQVLPNGRTIQITERPTPEGGLVITYHDVTALRRASAEIESLAFYDPLTNLPNRRLLMDRMQQVIAARVRSGQYGALLFLDLDHFKTLNDTMGHEVGDMLLPVWLHEAELNRINRSAFARDAYCQSWGCHTGESMSKAWKKATGSPMVGAIGKIDYSFMHLRNWKVALASGAKWSR